MATRDEAKYLNAPVWEKRGRDEIQPHLMLLLGGPELLLAVIFFLILMFDS